MYAGRCLCLAYKSHLQQAKQRALFSRLSGVSQRLTVMPSGLLEGQVCQAEGVLFLKAARHFLLSSCFHSTLCLSVASLGEMRQALTVPNWLFDWISHGPLRAVPVDSKAVQNAAPCLPVCIVVVAKK